MHIAGAVAAAAIALANGAVAQAPAVPYLPIHPVEWNGMTNVIRLANSQLEVIVAPTIGRIASIRFHEGENVLRLDPAASGDFANHGGDWFWPVAQARWSAFNDGRDWPPPRLFEEAVWTASGWRTTDGGQSCQLQTRYGAPLNVDVTRTISLPPNSSRIFIRQRIKRTGDSAIAVSLWNISQVAKPDFVWLPGGAELKHLNFEPADGLVKECATGRVFDARGGAEHKLGSVSDEAWIAAQRENLALIERVENEPSKAEYPDGGCRVEMYSNSGLGYCEIETLSPETQLKSGERIQNRLVLELVRVATSAYPCGAVEPGTREP